MRQLHLFERPSRFVAGTVGTPGERTFYLQAAQGTRIVSVALEKQQVVILSDRLEQLLDEVVAQTGAAQPAAPTDNDALELPVDEEFRVSAMGLAWNDDAGLVVIEAQAPVESSDEAEQTLLEDVEDGPDALRVLIEPTEARAFIDRARKLVSGGRPPCPLCGQPLNADGHVCVRLNGFHRNVTLNT